MRLTHGHAVAIKRFDRSRGVRLHSLSAAVALRAAGERFGYPELAQLLRRRGVTALSPSSTMRRPLSPNTWTCVGALAIPLWATWPSLAIRTLDIPPFESLAVMIVVFGAAVGLFRLRLRQVIGLAFGFSGAAILIWDGRVARSISGIGLALLSGACWAAYCVFRLSWKHSPPAICSRADAPSPLLCAPCFTSFSSPPFSLGAALLTWNLLAGAVVIVLAGLLSRTDA